MGPEQSVSSIALLSSPSAIAAMISEPVTPGRSNAGP